MTDSGRLNRKVITHPASSLAQDRESSPPETSVLTTILRRQPINMMLKMLSSENQLLQIHVAVISLPAQHNYLQEHSGPYLPF